MNISIPRRRGAAVLALALAAAATCPAQDDSLTLSNILQRILELEKQVAVLVQSALAAGTNGPAADRDRSTLNDKLRRMIGMAQEAGCLANLRMIQSAKDVFAVEYAKEAGDPVRPEDVSPFFPNGYPNVRCPAGGTYSLNPIGQPPTCSVHGDLLQAPPMQPPDRPFR